MEINELIVIVQREGPVDACLQVLLKSRKGTAGKDFCFMPFPLCVRYHDWEDFVCPGKGSSKVSRFGSDIRQVFTVGVNIVIMVKGY